MEGRARLGIPNAALPLDRRGPNHQLPKKIRVYELARELGLTNKEALDICVDLGIGVKSHSSSIEDAQADRARRKADREGLRRAVQPEEPAAAPRRGRLGAGRGAGRIPTRREHAGRRAARCAAARTDARAGAPDLSDGAAFRPAAEAPPSPTSLARVSASS